MKKFLSVPEFQVKESVDYVVLDFKFLSSSKRKRKQLPRPYKHTSGSKRLANLKNIATLLRKTLLTKYVALPTSVVPRIHR
jgi:hypothetical protein